VWRDAEFQEFYEANYGRVVAMAAVVLADRDQAQDVAQEAFARALNRWPRISGYELPEAWVRRVALRIAVDSGRRFRRAVKVSIRLAAQRQVAEPDPGDSLEFTALGAALRRLPLRERQVLALHYLADLPVEGIARECGLPVGTVKTRLATARRHLEAELSLQPEAMPDVR
jgi:RNA polymerase sigma-70 factor, ECF subfamily